MHPGSCKAYMPGGRGKENVIDNLLFCYVDHCIVLCLRKLFR